MVALSNRILLTDDFVLIFLLGNKQAELVCQGFMKNSAAAHKLPIQMEPCHEANLFNVRLKLQSQSEAGEMSHLLASVFEIVYPWQEPGYAPFDTGIPTAIRRL